MMQSKNDNARPLNGRVLEIEEAELGDDHPSYLSKPGQSGGDSREASERKDEVVSFVPRPYRGLC